MLSAAATGAGLGLAPGPALPLPHPTRTPLRTSTLPRAATVATRMTPSRYGMAA